MSAFAQCDIIVDIHLEMYHFIIYWFDAIVQCLPLTGKVTPKLTCMDSISLDYNSS